MHYILRGPIMGSKIFGDLFLSSAISGKNAILNVVDRLSTRHCQCVTVSLSSKRHSQNPATAFSRHDYDEEDVVEKDFPEGDIDKATNCHPLDLLAVAAPQVDQRTTLPASWLGR
jgi:hypothetical protein